MFRKARLQTSNWAILPQTRLQTNHWMLLQNTKSIRGGFTLIELLVVIVIISILLGILLPALGGIIERSRSKSSLAELHEIQMAITLYEQDHRDFPPSDLSAFGITRHNQINTGIECLAICLSGNQTNGQPYCVIKDRQIINTDADISPVPLRKLGSSFITNDLWEFCDPWENPYIYFHFRDLNPGTKHFYWIQGQKAGVAPCLQRGKTGTIPGQSSYQIFSMGSDGQPATMDDVMVP